MKKKLIILLLLFTLIFAITPELNCYAANENGPWDIAPPPVMDVPIGGMGGDEVTINRFDISYQKLLLD